MMLLDPSIIQIVSKLIAIIISRMIPHLINTSMKNLLKGRDQMVPSINNILIEVIISKNIKRFRKFLTIF